MTTETCELCLSDGGDIICEWGNYRIVLVDEPLYPGFCRVIAKSHLREMTGLSPLDQSLCMQLVCAVEGAIREVMQPYKVNLASLGTKYPHVHWHVIPRFADDALLAPRRAQVPALREAVKRHVQKVSGG